MGIDGCFGSAVWGTSSSNIYFVGYGGSIVHYDGVKFRKMESGTTINLRRIAGDGESVFITGYDNYDGKIGSISLMRDNGSWIPLSISESYIGDINNDDYGRMTAIDIAQDTAYIISKKGVLKYSTRSNSLEVVSPYLSKIIHNDYESMTAQASNDILIFGIAGFIVHYNGVSWTRIDQLSLPNIGEWYNTGRLMGNVAVMVGRSRTAGALFAKGIR